MALTTVVPAIGMLAGVTYNLPYSKTRPTSTLAFGSDQTAPERSFGMHVGAGTGNAFPGATTVDVIFTLSSQFLLAQSYAATFGGMMSAWADFKLAVVEGGLGTWTDVPPSGTKYLTSTPGVYGTVGKYIFTGRCIACTFDPQGDTVAEITTTIENPAGILTILDGGSATVGWLSGP